METIFNKATADKLIDRINLLSATDKAQWGKMDTFQMTRHCALSEEAFLGKKTYPRLFIGRLFGQMALNSILKNTGPVKKNQPTHPAFVIKESGDVEAEKAKWVKLLKEYEDFNPQNFVHPFFGKMSKEQIGQFVYKHTDHHLKQFAK